MIPSCSACLTVALISCSRKKAHVWVQTAIMAAADLFRAFGDEALPFVDFGGASRPANSLLAALLAKSASNDKRFVIEAVAAAMAALWDSVSPVLLVVRLLPYSIHKNPKARSRWQAPLLQQLLSADYLLSVPAQPICRRAML